MKPKPIEVLRFLLGDEDPDIRHHREQVRLEALEQARQAHAEVELAKRRREILVSEQQYGLRVRGKGRTA